MRIAIIITALALAACEQAAAPAPTMPPGVETPEGVLVAAGQDWRLAADPSGSIVLTRADGGATTADYVAPGRTPSGFRFNARGLRVVLEWQPCMHDGGDYPFRAVVTAAGQPALEGCAKERWDTALTYMLPYIDRCLAQSPQTRWVRYVGGVRDGMLLVRLSGEGGDVDCRTSLQDDVPGTHLFPRDESLRFIGEDAYVFVRAPGANPGGECYEAPEVRGEDGALLGWAADPEGC